MSDPNFDPCECIWNHELAMRRLISLVWRVTCFFLTSQVSLTVFSLVIMINWTRLTAKMFLRFTHYSSGHLSLTARITSALVMCLDCKVPLRMIPVCLFLWCAGLFWQSSCFSSVQLPCALKATASPMIIRYWYTYNLTIITSSPICVSFFS